MQGRDLFSQVVSFENLHRSFYQVLRGKRRREAAGDLFLNLERELLRLRRQLLEGSYRPGAYRTFWIRDPKLRLISAAPILDRVVHHALVGVIEPIFERRFIHHSYANRKGKGAYRALDQFVAWSRRHRYVLTMDIVKFFPSVDHQILKREIRRGIHERRVLALVDLIIDGSSPQEPVAQRHFPGDDLFSPFERRIGLPIGNLTSQFLANVLLDRLDHHVKDRLRTRAYLRYVDDCAPRRRGREAIMAA